MAANIAGVSGACYSDAGVSLAIGAKNPVEQYLDARFDIYDQDPPLAVSSADAPAVNVRKGYLPGHKSNAVDWCSAAPASASTEYYTYPSDRTVGTVTQNSPILTDVESTTGVTSGEPIVDAAGYIASASDNPATVSGSAGSTITLATQASGTEAGDGLTVEWTTSGLPEDISFPNLGGAEGNGAVGLRQLLGHQSSARPAGRRRRDCAWRRVRNPGADNGKPLPGLPIRNRRGSRRGGHRRLVGTKRLGEQRPVGPARRHGPAR